MAFGDAHSRQTRARRVPVVPPGNRPYAPERGRPLQWGVAATVGMLLGVYILTVATLPSKWASLCLLAVLCPIIVMIIGQLRRVLLAIIILDIPFSLDIHLGYRVEAGEMGAIAGLGLSATTICLIVLYTLWLGKHLLYAAPSADASPRMSWPLASYLVISLLSIGVAYDAALAIFQVFILLQTFLLYLYIVNTVHTRQDMLFIVRVLLIGLILESLVIIGLGLLGQDFSIAGISSHTNVAESTAGQFYRVSGTVGSPSSAAGYLSLLLAPMLSLLLSDLGRGYKWLVGLTSCLGGLALMFTFTRGGWLAFAVSSTMLCVLVRRRVWFSLAVPVVFTVVLAILLWFFQDAIATRVFDREAALGRLPLIQLAFRIIKEHPLLGVGADNSSVLMAQYVTRELDDAWLYAVHNKYLLIWAETGLGGLVAFLAFLLMTIRQGWQCWRHHDPLLSPLALGFIAAVVGHMVQMLFEPFNHRPLVQLLWLIAGLITAMHALAGKGSAAAPGRHTLPFAPH